MKPIQKVKKTDKGLFLISDEPIRAGEYRYNVQRNTIHVADKDGIEYYNKRSDVYKRAIKLDEEARVFTINDICKAFERGMAVNIYLANFQTDEEYSRLLIELIQSE